MKNYAIYIRVSTTRQGESGLGLESQLANCERFIRQEGGAKTKVFKDVDSGRNRARPGLWAAINHCEKTGDSLVIAKLDRLARDVEFTFKVINTGIDIRFADMPQVNTVILGVIASVSQYEAELISTRTKAALAAKKARGEQTGGTKELWGRVTGASRKESVVAAAAVSAQVRRDKAKKDPANIAFKEFMEDWREAGKKLDWAAIADKLNSRGRKTTTGLPFTPVRARSMYEKTRKLYSTKQVWIMS